MKRYKCVVAYEGGAYEGWQSQHKGNSVQEQIESVLHKVAHQKISILVAGRTDAKVNAQGQVFHFDSDFPLTARKWQGALNGYLPKDIHIVSVEEVDQLFHARYCVRQKQYDYHIHTSTYDVFSRNTAYQYPKNLDITKMRKGAKYLVGTHDFTSFNSNSLKDKPNQIKTIYSITITKENNDITISYIGKGFLRYMVRMMSAALIEVGKGKMKPEDIQKMLMARSKTISRRNAAPEGLTLVKIDYYQVLAQSDKVLVRQFLPEDTLPKGYTLKSIDKAIAEDNNKQIFAFVSRDGIQQLGIFQFNRKKNENEGSLVLFKAKSKSLALSVKPGLEQWLVKEDTKKPYRLNILTKSTK